MVEASSSNSWNWEQEKAFENALAIHFEDIKERWEKIAQDLPEKTIEDIKQHYELLLEDIDGIDTGKVPLPCYSSSSEDFGVDGGKRGRTLNHGDSGHSGKGSKSELERRKGIAWTEDEHRLFLLGLEKYGKGDWRSISRNYVVTRTPTQVASHAQKYFIRLNSMNKERRRTSIHDITSLGNNQDAVAPQAPITGQTGNNNQVSSNNSINNNGVTSKQSSPGTFGTAIGQPVGGTAPAVGTPVHMPYGTVVPGAPVGMSYPMPNHNPHR